VTVSKGELGPLGFVAEGGYGRVYTVLNYHLPDDDTALAYKEFFGDSGQRKRSAEAAKRAAEFRDRITESERAVLDRYSTWPRELVVDEADEVIGFLMPLIPDPFSFQTIDVKSGLLANTPRNLEWLIATEQQRQAAKSNLPEIRETDRLYLISQLIYAVAWLHHRGWVFGDVSFKNAAFTLDPPRLMLFDCDGAAAMSDGQREQAHTPFWLPPEFIAQQPGRKQDTSSDVYKLGLALVRCLKSERGASQTRDVSRLAGILSDEGVALVTRALADEPAERPSARDLYTYLHQFTAPRLKPPTVAHLAMTTPFLLLRGADTRLSWQTENAEEIRILAGERQEEVTTVKAADHPAGCAFRMTEPGLVTVVVSNPYGRVTRVVGDVMLYEIPPFNVSVDSLPPLSVPEMAAFSLAPVAQLAPSLPGIPDIPPLPSAQPYDLMDHLSGNHWLAAPSQRIDGVIQDGAHAIVGLISGASQRFVDSLRDMTQRKEYG
jgi:hypothetical protein